MTMSDLFLLAGRKAVMAEFNKLKEEKMTRSRSSAQGEYKSRLPLVSGKTFHDLTKGNAVILISLYGCAPCIEMDDYLGNLNGVIPPIAKLELRQPTNLREFKKTYGISVPKKVPALYFYRDGELVCTSIPGIKPEEVPALSRAVYRT